MANQKITNDSRTLDAQSRVMLYEGLNQSQLGILFRMDNRTIQRKIHNVEPVGFRNGTAIYAISDVAPYLCKPAGDIEGYIKRMHSADLPKHLSKEFWAAQKSKQDFELRAGDLWPTAKVIEKVGELMKLVRMSLQLIPDRLEREDELTDRQRTIVQELMYEVLEELRSLVVKNFSKEESQANDAPEQADDDEI